MKKKTESDHYRSKEFLDTYKEEIKKTWDLGLPITYKEGFYIVQEHKDGRKVYTVMGKNGTGKSTK